MRSLLVPVWLCACMFMRVRAWKRGPRYARVCGVSVYRFMSLLSEDGECRSDVRLPRDHKRAAFIRRFAQIYKHLAIYTPLEGGLTS